MSISLQQESNWRQMATIEVRDHFDDLGRLLADLSLDFRLEPAQESPTGYAWFNLLIDASKGERRCARTAYALLSAMQHIAAEGGIPDFRIVARSTPRAACNANRVLSRRLLSRYTAHDRQHDASDIAGARGRRQKYIRR